MMTKKLSLKILLSTLVCFFIVIGYLLVKAQIKNLPQNRTFLAGASISDVTPNKADRLMKNKNLHDQLFSRALVLDNGENKIALVVIDNQGVPGFIIEAAKKKIYQQTNISPSNIIISSTHTHSGIFAGNPINLRKSDDPYDDYQKLLISRITESVSKANHNLLPAKIGWGSVKKPEHVFNRRWYLKNPVKNPFGQLDSVKTNPGSAQKDALMEPAGPTDPEVSFLAVKSLSDEHIALFSNYSLHYVGTPNGDVSADYYGEYERQLKKLLNTDAQSIEFVGIMSNGTSGDVNNLNPKTSKSSLSHYEKIQLVAEDIAKSIVSVYNTIEFHNWVPLKTNLKTVDLNLRVASKDIISNIDKIALSKKENLKVSNEEQKYATRAKNFTKLFPKQTAVDIQSFLIGELVIGAAPFEMFAETGLELKEKSPFENTFIVGLANGHWGYLPPPSQHAKGGYETWYTVSRVQENASEIIVDSLLTQFNSFK